MEQSSLNDFSEKGKRTTVEIFVDEKENRGTIGEILKELGVVVRVKTLPVGDFIISDRAVIERKTRSDFESSIIDGRLFKQAENMIDNFEKCIVIIEGESFEERVNRNALLGAISALILDYGIQVFFTRDLEATGEMIFNLAKREQLGKGRIVRLKGSKKVHTMAQQQRMIAECLPNVGPKLALALLRKFKTIENIAKASERELMEVEKIGKKKAKFIRRALSEEFCE
ncbi:MAG: helix-hairpin-helix domain-containing protein [Candidatus Micrarchaeota archaeon]|nr:helix-hairpin-helix domain-containing protein [Candidatus Micrarchaeota archaeon]